MRTLALLPFVAIVALILVMSACAPREEQKDTDTGLTGNVVALTDTEDDTPLAGGILDQEVLLDGATFMPAVIEAAAGERLRLVFLLDEPHAIVAPGLGLAQDVQNDVVDLGVLETGVYILACEDCEGLPTIEIRVR